LYNSNIYNQTLADVYYSVRFARWQCLLPGVCSKYQSNGFDCTADSVVHYEHIKLWRHGRVASRFRV